MDYDTDNEFPRNYGSEIALECDRLERTLRVGLEEYDNSALLLGKNAWFAVALENNDHDKTQDANNKKNILMSLIEKVVNFIKMIGQKIVEWYRACKQAILKFFGKENIDPRLVQTRFGTLIEGLTVQDATKLVAAMSKESKNYLAEVLDKDFSTAFLVHYSVYKKIGDKCDNTTKFAQNYAFFNHYREGAAELRTIAQKNKIYESVDDLLIDIISGKQSSSNVEAVSNIFNEITAVQDSHTVKLERLLKYIPGEDLDALPGDNPDVKRRDMVNLISEVIKINADVVMKINHYMQAISMLMTYVVKYRSKRAIYIPM
jgi:hypothetical protein